MTQALGVRLPIADAAPWVDGSLAQGSALAQLVRQRVADSWSALLLGPATQGGQWRCPLSATGTGAPVSEADAAAVRLLARVARAGLCTLLVEDDVARRSDPRLGEVAFIDDRVVRWDELDPSSTPAVALLRASTYPLNGFLCRAPVSDLGLEQGRSLGPEALAAIAEATAGVVVSVYDGEGYVAVLAPPVADSLG